MRNLHDAEARRVRATGALERGTLTLVVKSVPTGGCPDCSERYVDEAVTRELLETAEEEARSGTQVSVREYAPA